jgi:hypothetical protein
MRDDVNIRSPRFLLARTIGICRHCLSPTPLVGLALPPGHMVLELDHEAHDDAEAIDAWRIASGSAFIFEVEFIPAAVQSRIQQITRLFKRRGGCGCLLDQPLRTVRWVAGRSRLVLRTRWGISSHERCQCQLDSVGVRRRGLRGGRRGLRLRARVFRRHALEPEDAWPTIT